VPNRAAASGDARAPRRRAGNLDLRAIVRTGIELADAEGLDGVSIRRIAARLHVRPMSLYTYISSKDGLLALMAGAVVAEARLTEVPEGWRGALRAIARSWHATFVAHPWLLEMAPRHSALLDGGQMLEAIAPLRLSEADTASVVQAIGDVTRGSATRITRGSDQAAAHALEGCLEIVLDGIARRFTW
jgi:AcrR family transcriptional regulator